MTFSRMIKNFLDLLFPIECLACGARGPDICSTCLENLAFPKEQNYDWITSLGNYHDPNMKKLMRHIKCMPNGRAVSLLTKTFADMIKNRPENPTSWVLIPVPITNKRFRERGYNQAELLAKHFSKAFNLSTFHNILYKTKHTHKQGTAKSKEERAQNILGSFGIKNSNLIQGKNIILIDDITTTGSTLVEIRNTLLAHGAGRVLAWTVAN